MARTQIEIKKDDLNMEDYDFYYFDDKKILVLDTYRKMSRQTKRHGWKVDSYYSRLRERDSSLKEQEVPLTEEIKKMAFDKFVSEIKVMTQSERGK